jgi:hypothetical protein
MINNATTFLKTIPPWTTIFLIPTISLAISSQMTTALTISPGTLTKIPILMMPNPCHPIQRSMNLRPTWIPIPTISIKIQR